MQRSLTDLSALDIECSRSADSSRSWRLGGEALSPSKLFKPFKTAELSLAIERSDAIEQLERLKL